MSFFTREQRYQYLCEVKRGLWGPGKPPLSEEENQFVQDYAMEKLDEILKDTEVVSAMQRSKFIDNLLQRGYNTYIGSKFNRRSKMAQVQKPTAVYVVELTEYERGWGSKPWDTKYFDNAEEAKAWALAYNREHNTASSAPDWYVRADYVGAR